jgi:hypothetical protein
MTQELTGSIYILWATVSFKLNLSKMSLATLTRYWPLDHTPPESLSKLDAGALVLVTGLVSFYPQVHLWELMPTRLVVVPLPGVPLVFPSL